MDKIVTLDEFTDFCVEQHFGEMAIQRLHRKNKYSRGNQRIMNKKEFEITLNHALDYINMRATPDQINLLFSEIDLEKKGWISYEIYFTFLKQYFGSLIFNPVLISSADEKEIEWLNSLMGLSGLQRFIRMLLDQLKHIFFLYDSNKNLLFEEDEIEDILKQVFGLSNEQTEYVLEKFFNFANRQDKSLTFDKLVAILLEIYFIDIVLKNNLTESEKKKNKINSNQFIQLVNTACFFLKKKPFSDDLIEIFKMLDTDSDGWISFDEYSDFIRKYLGLGIREVQPQPSQNTNSSRPREISVEEWDFINEIWGELKQYYDQYDSGRKGYHVNEDLKKFVIEVLGESSKRQLDYIFWNLFRFDPNSDCQIQFKEFAPFILNHTGEIALQKFHREQIKGKSALKEEELFIVFSNAFSFLSTMPKSEKAIKYIYQRIGKGKEPSYGAYLSWIHKALASKFE